MLASASALQFFITHESYAAATRRPAYQSVSVSPAIDTSSKMPCIPSACICCGECLKCHPKMQDGLNCRSETERTCPKSKPKSQKSTYRKLPQCHKSSALTLAKKKARYHPYLSQSGHIPNTNATTAFRYHSYPPYSTHQPYPFEHLVYPQHKTVPSSPQYECANVLRPHQFNARSVNTSQASLNIRHILQDSTHPSNTQPDPATKCLQDCLTAGVHLFTTSQGYWPLNLP